MSEERRRTRTATEEIEREERLAAALRANLRRRKEQARASNPAQSEPVRGPRLAQTRGIAPDPRRESAERPDKSAGDKPARPAGAAPPLHEPS